MNECEFCEEEQPEPIPAEMCGPKELGKECLCCGRVLIAKNTQDVE